METVVTLSIPVEVIEWNTDYQDAEIPFFDSYTQATMYWMRRADFNTTCVLSENPHTKQWYLISTVVCPDANDTDKKQIQFWHDAWADQRDTYGKACWDEYYRGVRDAELNMVFDREDFGEKIIQRLAKAMPKWKIQNKELKEKNS